MPATAQYNMPFYLQYLAKWPEYCLAAEGPGRQCMGYILGKAEGTGHNWHGHVTAVTVAPGFRCCPSPILSRRHAHSELLSPKGTP